MLPWLPSKSLKTRSNSPNRLPGERTTPGASAAGRLIFRPEAETRKGPEGI
jgi:hypothetical protein